MAGLDLLIDKLPVSVENRLEQRRRLLFEQRVELHLLAAPRQSEGRVDDLAHQGRVLTVELLDQRTLLGGQLARAIGAPQLGDLFMLARTGGSRSPSTCSAGVPRPSAMVICAMWFRLSRMRSTIVRSWFTATRSWS